MNQYRISLFPERSKTEEVFIEDSLDTVKSVAQIYNQNALKAANRKWIQLETVTIEQDTIRFVLASEAWLEFPTKAIRSFISMLAKYEPYRSLITPSGRLFKGDSEFMENKAAEQELLDGEVLIEVIKLFFPKTEESRKKIEKIREILKG